VTVSVDSLKADRFKKITRTGELSTVMRGLDRAEEVGFSSLKINCVTMRGTNDDEVCDFALLTLGRKLTVRFIEYMPLGDAAIQGIGDRGQGTGNRVAGDEVGPAGGCGAQDRGDCFISEGGVRERIEEELGELVAVDRGSESGVGPAVPYRLAKGNAKGRIGFISAMSEPFCSTCNRLRLTANGVLRSCLFEGGEVGIRELMRGISDSSARREAIAEAMRECVRLKPEVHSRHGKEQMSRIGG